MRRSSWAISEDRVFDGVVDVGGGVENLVVQVYEAACGGDEGVGVVLDGKGELGGVCAARCAGTLCFVVDRFSAFSDERSLKVAKPPAYLPWSKLKFYRK